MSVISGDVAEVSSPRVTVRPSTAPEFPTVFGRELLGELSSFAHRPYLVVTMPDLWPSLEHFFDSNLAGVHMVSSLDLETLTPLEALNRIAEWKRQCGEE